VQEFGDYVKVLRTDLQAGDFCLVLLYHQGASGAALNDMIKWVNPSMRSNLNRTLTRLEHDRAFVHHSGERYFITRTGQLEVETRKLYVATES
jgi:hypothetical protein